MQYWQGECLEAWPKQIMATIGPISSEAGPSLEEILSRHGLKVEDLKTECSREIRNDIALELGADWEVIGLYLEFSLDELGDIENASTVVQKFNK